jgi:hypothetical protein
VPPLLNDTYPLSLLTLVSNRRRAFEQEVRVSAMLWRAFD